MESVFPQLGGDQTQVLDFCNFFPAGERSLSEGLQNRLVSGPVSADGSVN